MATTPKTQSAVKPVPTGYHALTPMCTVTGAKAVLDFVRDAFGASLRHRFDNADGTVMHAEVEIGDSPLMIGEANEKAPAMPTAVYFYTTDVDMTYNRAIKAGGKSIQSPADQMWGDRTACVKDASGNAWYIATHVEDVAPEELSRRMKAMTSKKA